MLDVNTITTTLPKLMEKGTMRPVSQSRFLQEINKAVETITKINPAGLNTPVTIAENNGAFAVSEGGPILPGNAPQYSLTTAFIRSLWKSVNWTGSVERIRDDYLTQMSHAGMANLYSQQGAALQEKAFNHAVRDALWSTFRVYARIENYFALQGIDSSAIGTVTAASSVTNIVACDGLTTSIGNRMIDWGSQVEFRDPAGVLRNGDVAQGWTVVDQQVEHDADGEFHVADCDNGVLPGDGVFFRNGYGGFPTGVPFYVDDTGEYKGQLRSVAPQLFKSVMIRHTNSPTISPLHVRQQLARMQPKVGFNMPLRVVLWMNPAQKFNWESFIYNSLLRQVPADRVRIADYAVQEFEWDGRPLNIDPDVPPSALYVLNMLTWRKIQQTKLQVYLFDDGAMIINAVDLDGNRLDSKQTTIFSEYNWDCTNPSQNSIQDGFGFNYDYLAA